MFHDGMKRKTKTVFGQRLPLRMKSRHDLVELLDQEFSFNVRAREVIAGGGVARCVTCGAPGGMTELDCGHYITRAIHRTRWLRINTGVQCHKCNRFMNGMPHVFRAYLVQKFGDPSVKALEEAARDTGWRDSVESLVVMIEALRAENRKFRKELKCLAQ